MSPGRRATRREWIGLAVIALPCLVYAMDLSVLNLAVPAITRDLHPSGAQLLWIVDVYGFMVAGALITMGALSDRIGARRLLMLGAVAFAAASLLTAFAMSAVELIAARALLGLAGATVAPSTLSLIRTMFADSRQRTFAIGVWVTSYSVGAAIGPLVGGALLQLFWWGAAFLPAVPVMALVLVLGPRTLPEHREVAGGRLDLVSAGQSLVAVLLAIYGLKSAATGGSLVVAVGLMVVGAGLGVAFVARQRRLASPLIDVGLFRVPAFSVGLSTNLVAFFAIFGISIFAAQYLQLVLGYSPLAAGLWSVPEALGFVGGSMLTPRLARWSGPSLVAAGSGVGAAGYLLVASAGGVAPLVIGMTVGALGLGVVITLVTDLAVGAAPPSRAGSAAATAETSSELGGALGIAILGSLGAAIYRGALVGAPHAVRATLAGALSDDRWAGAAQLAFSHALRVTALVGAAALMVAALATIALLRPRVAIEPVPSDSRIA